MPDKVAARAALEVLVAEYRAGRYSAATSEADIREFLIVPLLRDVLGWNTSDNREFSRELFSRGSGFADCVLLDGARAVLYLEAKRLGKIPALSELKRRSAFYTKEEEQALRYARRSTNMRDDERWTILTNFERTRVFEATREDRVLEFESPDELLDRFDDLWLLAKPELMGGNLKRVFAQRRKPEVDEEFRETLNNWRRLLADDIYLKNAARFALSGPLGLDVLQGAVQRLLDRLILVQFAADVDALGDEDPLRDLLERTAPPTSRRALVMPRPLREALFEAFRRFDEFYNTSLFAPGHAVETLDITETLLREVIESIASQSFRRFDADILGTTYETYLGHQLVLRSGHVELELKPAVRRAGGVYYTPREVVNAIVDLTLAPLISAATSVEELEAMRVVDPACGSGSFLIRAFEVFADWYDAENARRQAVRDASNTLEELGEPPIDDYGKRILERNIYGVDLDPEAAELATVNLIMQAMRRGHAGLHLGRLPLLFGQNVKVGNSVVPGIPAVNRLAASAPADLARLQAVRSGLRDAASPADEAIAISRCDSELQVVRAPHLGALTAAYPDLADRTPFFWELEFPEVFDPALPEDERGFSAVIGNPPWIGFTGDVVDRPYLTAHYTTTSGRYDIYVPFIELSLDLLRRGGRLGLVTPSNYFLRDYGAALRKRLREQEKLEVIVDYGSRQLFHGATNYPAVTIAVHVAPGANQELVYLRDAYDLALGRRHPQATLSDDGWVFVSEAEERVLEHVEAIPDAQTLEDICRLGPSRSGLAEGVITGQNRVFLLDSTFVLREGIEPALLRPCVKGEDVERWCIAAPPRQLVYPYRNDRVVDVDELRRSPILFAWLELNRTVSSKKGGLSGRDYFDESGKEWYELWNQRSEDLLSVPKVVTPEVSDRPEFALVDGPVAFTNSVTSATPSPASGLCQEYLVGVLNSTLLALLHARRSVPKANGYLIYTPAFLKRLPIRANPGDAVWRQQHDQLVACVGQCMRLMRELRTAAASFEDVVGTYPIGNTTIHGRANALGAGAREYLLRDSGQIRRMRARRDADGSLVIFGEVRINGTAYDRGEFDTADLLRLRVPEPIATFLEFYVPVAGERFARGTGPRNLGARAGDLLLPEMSDAEIAAAVTTFVGLRRHEEQLRATLASAELDINETVMDIYGLPNDMKATVRAFVPPAEVFRAVGS